MPAASVTAEQLFDKISTLLLSDINNVFELYGLTDITQVQKTISPTTGQITVGRSNDSQKLVLFQLDAEAHSEDALVFTDILANENVTPDTLSAATITFNNQFPITFSVGGHNYDISGIYNQDVDNPINLGQFIDTDRVKVNIDPAKLKTVLNTNIIELIGEEVSNQQDINSFFSLWHRLKGNPPNFNFDGNDDGVNETWETDLDIHQQEYSEEHDISTSKPKGFITRLNKHAVGINAGKTLQSLHSELSLYLGDIINPVSNPMDDFRTPYVNKSEGYLKLRHLNQGMIIRKQEGLETGIEKLVDVPYNPIHRHSNTSNIPSYLADGFTITMWVRFLDKSTIGTLFNYGNPLRNIDPKGFMLETYVLNADDSLDSSPTETWGSVASSNYMGPDTFFKDSSTERFVRLVVRDHVDLGGAENMDGTGTTEGRLYDSHVGLEPTFDRGLFVPQFGESGTSNYNTGNEKLLLTHTRIPMNFSEWYFIVASYDPTIQDDTEFVSSYSTDKAFWEGNINPLVGGNQQTHRSGYGSKCKVEVISRSDLLRARGYRFEE